MTDNAKRTDKSPSTSVSAPSSATPATETNLQDFPVPHVLPNGTSILIRAVRPDDKERLRAAFGELEKTSIYTRFFGHRKELTEAELEQATNVDLDRVVALWATTIDSSGAEIIIGGGRYVRNADPASWPNAEVAFAVEEDYHGQGIASCLLGHLVRIARSKGLVQFEADVLAANRPMLAVFAHSGLPMRQQSARDVIHITLSLDGQQPHLQQSALQAGAR
jgi:GNAT superfamily N-acetyltransferase